MEQVPLGKQLKSVSNLFSRHLNQIPLYHEGENLTPMQRMIIVVVHEKSQTQDVFQRDLEKFFSIRRSTVTGVLQLMEKRGLLVREHSTQDGRLKRLCLTDQANALFAIIQQNLQEAEALLCQGLTKEEIAFFSAILAKMEQNIR